jgi:alkylated DNA repair dioxygenase AlkB
VSLPPDLLIDRSAASRRVVLDETSWVDLVEGFVPSAAERLAEFVEGVDWAQGEVLRYDRYVAEQRLGAGWRPDRHPLTRQVDLHLRAAYQVQFEGVTAILYRDGSDFLGLHSDREMKWLDDTLIAIVVLGERRRFVLRRRGPWLESLAGKVPQGEHPDDIVLTPGDGDMIVMGGRCQRDWMHGIPGESAEVGERLSLTWRWTSRRGEPDTRPSYFDGRQFSDAPRRSGTRSRRP